LQHVKLLLLVSHLLLHGSIVGRCVLLVFLCTPALRLPVMNCSGCACDHCRANHGPGDWCASSSHGMSPFF
jgi:hypothetical protein